jgi:hypothetical protein
LQKGGVSGDAQAALSAGSLAAKAGALPAGSSAALGAAGDVLGLYNGIKQGGVEGGVNAALSGAQLAGAAANAGLMGSGAAAGAASAIGAFAGVAAPVAAAFMGMEALADHSQYNAEDAMGNAQTFVGTSNQALQKVIQQGYGPGSQQYEYAMDDVNMAALQKAAVDNPATWSTTLSTPDGGGGIGRESTARVSES